MCQEPRQQEECNWGCIWAIIAIFALAMFTIGGIFGMTMIAAQRIPRVQEVSPQQKPEIPATKQEKVVSGDNKAVVIGDNNKDVKVHVGDITNVTNVQQITIIQAEKSAEKKVKPKTSKKDCDDLLIQHQQRVSQWQGMMQTK